MNPEVFDASAPFSLGEFVRRLFTADFMPHGHCYYWRPDILWLNVISDCLIAFSYYAIPCILVYFVIKKRDIPFHWMFVMFGVFIIACGTTHIMEIVTIWHATYRLSAVIKLVTALASVATMIALIPILPRALALPSQAALNSSLAQKSKELERANKELEEFNTLAMGRENRILELKKEVNQLSEQFGKSAPYKAT